MTNLRLSKGAIDAILEGRVESSDPTFQPPLMQLLGVKLISEGLLRVVLYDGLTIDQHGLLLLDDDKTKRLFVEGHLDKFAVVRVMDCSANAVPAKNMTVLLISKIELMCEGKEVNVKLQGTDWAYLSGGGGGEVVTEETSSAVVTAAEEAAGAPTLAYRREATATAAVKVKVEGAATVVAGSASATVSKRSAATTTSTPSPSSSSTLTGQVEGVAVKGEAGDFPSGSTSLQGGNVVPVNTVTPYDAGWVIRVRVTSKTPLKTYNTARGSGHLFSFDTVDQSGGELRIVAFNAEADKWYEVIERGRVYLISKGAVKPADKRFSLLKAEYEVTLTAYSVIKPVDEPLDEQAAGDIPLMRYNFKQLSDVVGMTAGTTIDVIGVVRTVGEMESFVARNTGRQMAKRVVTIVDRSLYEARLTLWAGGHAEAFSANVGEVVALKSVRVGEFKGKTLSTAGSTVVDVEPAGLAEVDVLRQWYHGAAQGAAEAFTSLGGGVGATRPLDVKEPEYSGNEKRIRSSL